MYRIFAQSAKRIYIVRCCGAVAKLYSTMGTRTTLTQQQPYREVKFVAAHCKHIFDAQWYLKKDFVFVFMAFISNELKKYKNSFFLFI